MPEETATDEAARIGGQDNGEEWMTLVFIFPRKKKVTLYFHN